MSKLSRRSIVTGAAALPALAVPAVASDADDDHWSRLPPKFTKYMSSFTRPLSRPTPLKAPRTRLYMLRRERRKTP